PTAMTVDARPSGSPVLRSWLGELDLSITHSGDWALACTCPPGWWMGLDFEVGADVRVHLSKRVCSAAQRTLHGLDPERGTQERPGTFGAIWTIKEALLKAWRVGLVDPLDAIRVGRLPAELDGPVEVSLATSIHPDVPWPLPPEMWVGVARWKGAPLAAVAARGAL
ncbi:MAG: 4'-phosphopantetheinyl transferase superfamily protein, partial [Myxococcota bacterium]